MNYDELNALSDYELKDIEDSYLLQREMDPSLRVKHTGGRFVLFALSVAIWLVLKLILVNISVGIKPQMRGIFSFVTFFLSLFAAGVISHFIWKKATVEVRFYIRNLVHYWPISFYIILTLLVLFKA